MMPNLPNCYYRLSAKALVLDETKTKFLIIKRVSGKWDLPGGGIEWGEKALDALKREVMEETGLELKICKTNPSYFLTNQNSDKTKYYANVLFEASLDDFSFTPSDECIEMLFVSPEEALQFENYGNIKELASLFDGKNHF